MNSIERMGDQCVNICKVIPLTGHDAPQRAEMVERIVKMGKQGALDDPRRRRRPSSAAMSSWRATWSARTT